MKTHLLKITLGLIMAASGLNSFAQCPAITCPANITTFNDPGSCDAVVTFTAPVGTDPCLGSQTFSYTGSMQTFTVPNGVSSITIGAYGAQGGFDGTVAGGQGGYATGTLAVVPGQVLNIYVGGKGTDGPGTGQNCLLAGGFNGGGNTGAVCCSNAGGGAGAGGGASDVRMGGITLNDRVIVGAGGGGAGDNIVGSTGGGLNGTNGTSYNGVTSTGGTQTAGGQAGGTYYPNHTCSPATNGTFGQGGEGDGNDGGGGGGGWYGGGGAANNGPGSGGSSYIGGVTSGLTTTGGRTGNGEITINYTPSGTVSTTQTAGPASGSAFPVGNSTITFEASNGVQTATCSFIVTVVDSSAPSISCPANITTCDPVVTGIAPSTADNCSGETVTFNMTGATTGSGTNDASGTTFNTGTTEVWYIVTDAAGNKDSCSFDVVISPIDNSTTVSGVTTTATATGATYVWLDCNNGFADITGATSQSYTATSNGSYAVEITQNGCTDTSACVSIAGVGVNELRNNQISIYPNPTSNVINIDLGNSISINNYSIYTIDGRVVKEEKSISGNNIRIDLSDESEGIYFLKIANLYSVNVYKIIKQ